MLQGHGARLDPEVWIRQLIRTAVAVVGACSRIVCSACADGFTPHQRTKTTAKAAFGFPALMVYTPFV